MRSKRLFIRLSVAAVMLSFAAAARADDKLLKSAATGDPGVKSINAISFGPQGLLLIGDGRGKQIVCIDTGDTTPRGSMKAAVERIDEKLAERLGTTAKGIEILHLAVNQASGVAYFAIRKQDDK